MKAVGKNFKTIAIVVFVGAILDIIIHRPQSIEQMLRQQGIPRTHHKPIEIPELVSLRKYLKAIARKQLFVYNTKSDNEDKARQPINWLDFQINGVVYLDKPYVAIFWKSRREQYLVPEGSSLGGLTVKKIEKIKKGSKSHRVIFETEEGEKVIEF